MYSSLGVSSTPGSLLSTTCMDTLVPRLATFLTLLRFSMLSSNSLLNYISCLSSCPNFLIICNCISSGFLQNFSMVACLLMTEIVYVYFSCEKHELGCCG